MAILRESLLDQFEAGKICPAEFHHLQHVEVAWEMLQRHPFLEASTRYAKTIRAMAESAGALQKFNLTITLAFLSLIAERMAEARYSSFEEFSSRNADLLSPEVLGKKYSPQRLTSEIAREVFLMPDRS